jgi:hypothetical protein
VQIVIEQRYKDYIQLKAIDFMALIQPNLLSSEFKLKQESVERSARTPLTSRFAPGGLARNYCRRADLKLRSKYARCRQSEYFNLRVTHHDYGIRKI